MRNVTHKIILFGLALILFSSFVYAGVADDLNSIAQIYYTMDESGSPLYNKVPGNADAICADCPTFQQTPAWINYSIDFDKSNYEVFSSTLPNNPGTSPMSFCMMIKVDADATSTIFGNVTGGTPYQQGLYVVGGQLRWYPQYTDGSNYLKIETDTGVLGTSNTHHVCFVRESASSGKIYINGTDRTNAVTLVGSASVTRNAFYVGGGAVQAGSTNALHYWDGLIDEFSYYNDSLTLTEVEWLFNDSTPSVNRRYEFQPDSAPLFTLTAVSNATGATVNNFTATLYNSTWTNTTVTTNGTVYYNISHGDYSLSVVSTDYATYYANLTDVNNSESHQASLLTTNTIHFRVYDTIKLELINHTNVTIDLLSDLAVYNFTTDNGTYTAEIITPSTYTIRSDASGYATNFYEYTLVNSTNVHVNLYLMNTSATNYKQVIATVYDQNRDEVEDALIKVLRYNIESNSYTVRQMLRTNFEGQAPLELIKFEEYYKFIIEYDGIERLETTKTQIYEDTLSFQISIGDELGDDFYNSYKVTSSLDYLNASNTFRYYFSDAHNQVTQGCLKVYRNDVSGVVFLNQSCTSGTSGVLYTTFEVKNETSYTAYGYIYLGDTELLIETNKIYFSSTPDLGGDAWFLNIILSLVLVFTAIWSIPLAIALVPVPTVILSNIGWINVEPSLALGMWAIFIITSLILKVKR